jgi:hypothetical protein
MLECIFHFKNQIYAIAKSKIPTAQGSVFNWTKDYYNKKPYSDLFKDVSKEFQASLRIRLKALPFSSAKDYL